MKRPGGPLGRPGLLRYSDSEPVWRCAAFIKTQACTSCFNQPIFEFLEVPESTTLRGNFPLLSNLSSCVIETGITDLMVFLE